MQVQPTEKKPTVKAAANAPRPLTAEQIRAAAAVGNADFRYYVEHGKLPPSK